MSESNPNPATSEAMADQTDPEGLDAAELAFSKGQQTTQAADPGAEPEDKSDNTEADAADPEADEATDELVQVEFEGKQYELPPELQKALLRQSDYSRKMNEVSSQEKTYAERLKAVETITEGAEEYAGALASVRMVEAQLKQFEAIDWDQIEQSDPQNAARLAVQQLRLQRQYQAAQDAARTIGQKVQADKGQLFQAARSDMVKALEKNLKGWGDGQAMGVALTEYATKNGMKTATLENLTDPAMVIALDKARRYDELQASKTAIRAKAQGAPQVVKPGAPRGKPNAAAESLAKLRKSNSVDDAAAAFLARGR